MLTSFIVTPVSIFSQWALTFGHAGLPELGIAGIPARRGDRRRVRRGGLVLHAVQRALPRAPARAPPRARLPACSGACSRMSWQPALHMVARSLMVMFFMIMAGHLGGKVQAAYTIGLRLEMLAIMLAFPIANACATLVGQNLGARQPPARVAARSGPAPSSSSRRCGRSRSPCSSSVTRSSRCSSTIPRSPRWRPSTWSTPRSSSCSTGCTSWRSARCRRRAT